MRSNFFFTCHSHFKSISSEWKERREEKKNPNNYLIIDGWSRTYYAVALRIHQYLLFIHWLQIADHDQHYIDSLIYLVHIRVINGVRIVLSKNWLNKLINLIKRNSHGSCLIYISIEIPLLWHAAHCFALGQNWTKFYNFSLFAADLICNGQSCFVAQILSRWPQSASFMSSGWYNLWRCIHLHWLAPIIRLHQSLPVCYMTCIDFCFKQSLGWTQRYVGYNRLFCIRKQWQWFALNNWSSSPLA